MLELQDYTILINDFAIEKVSHKLKIDVILN